MATTTKKSPLGKSTDRRAKLLASLKKHVAEYRSLRHSAELIYSRIFLDTYAYIEAYVAFEGTTEQVAIDRLAKMLKKPAKSVDGWYYAGQFMREHKLPAGTFARAVRAVYNHAGVLPRHKLLKAIDMIRKDADSRRIVAYVQKDAAVARDSALRRANRVSNQGLTKTRVKMEAMGLATLAKRQFKREVRVYICDAKTDAVLLETE